MKTTENRKQVRPSPIQSEAARQLAEIRKQREAVAALPDAKQGALPPFKGKRLFEDGAAVWLAEHGLGMVLATRWADASKKQALVTVQFKKTMASVYPQTLAKYDPQQHGKAKTAKAERPAKAEPKGKPKAEQLAFETIAVPRASVLQAATYAEPKKEVTVTFKDGGKTRKFSGVKSIVVTYWKRAGDFDRFFQQHIAR